MNRGAEIKTCERKLVIQPIRLKSINQERAFNRSLQLNKCFSVTLTDQKFEKQIKELEKLRFPRTQTKFDMDSLKLEIANATSKALKSVHSYSLSKESFKSARRSGFGVLGSAENSPLVTERANFSGFFEGYSFKLDTPKKNSSLDKELRGFNKSFQEPSRRFVKEAECSLDTKTKENVFIDKIKEATMKLREMRQKLNRYK